MIADLLTGATLDLTYWHFFSLMIHCNVKKKLVKRQQFEKYRKSENQLVINFKTNMIDLSNYPSSV